MRIGFAANRVGGPVIDTIGMRRACLRFNLALLDQLALAFIVSRVVYFVCYLADWGPLRSLVWMVGMGLIVSLFVVSA